MIIIFKLIILTSRNNNLFIAILMLIIVEQYYGLNIILQLVLVKTHKSYNTTAPPLLITLRVISTLIFLCVYDITITKKL